MGDRHVDRPGSGKGQHLSSGVTHDGELHSGRGRLVALHQRVDEAAVDQSGTRSHDHPGTSGGAGHEQGRSDEQAPPHRTFTEAALTASPTSLPTDRPRPSAAPGVTKATTSVPHPTVTSRSLPTGRMSWMTPDQ